MSCGKRAMNQPEVCPPLGAVARVRPARAEEIEAVQGLIEAAMASWGSTPRLLRLSAPLYRIDAAALAEGGVWVAEDARYGLLGVAMAAPAAVPFPQGRVFDLQGLFVAPACQGQGVGRRLVAAVAEEAVARGYAGLLVKAHARACGFFERLGCARLPVGDARRDYPHRYWLSLGEAPSTLTHEEAS